MDWWKEPKVKAVIKEIVDTVHGDTYDTAYVVGALMQCDLIISEDPGNLREQIVDDIKREFDPDNEEYGSVVNDIIHLVEYGELPG